MFSNKKYVVKNGFNKFLAIINNIINRHCIITHIDNIVDANDT